MRNDYSITVLMVRVNS